MMWKPRGSTTALRLTSIAMCRAPTFRSNSMHGIMRHCCVILTLLVLCGEWSNNYLAAEAFVTPRLLPANVGAPGSRGAPAAGATANEISSRGTGGGWRTVDHLPRRRRIREGGRGEGRSERNACGRGVRSLRAGLGFPPLPGSELVDFVARELVEQSVRHHWQSGFIGGSVGVMGTLTAIQVCLCVCACSISLQLLLVRHVFLP